LMLVSSSPLLFSPLSSMGLAALARTPWWARCGQSKCGLGSAQVEGWWLREGSPESLSAMTRQGSLGIADDPSSPPLLIASLNQ
jgi:hypothetical protein